MTQFRATTSTTQSISGLAQMNFGTVDVDTDGVFSSGRCTVPASWNGDYGEFYVGIRFSATAIGYLDIQVSTNGGTIWTTVARKSFDTTTNLAVQSGPVLLNTGDIYRAACFTESAETISDEDRTFFSGRVIAIYSPQVQEHFRAHASVGQTIPNAGSSTTQLVFGIEDFDDGANFVGGVYTVPADLNGGYGIFTGGVADNPPGILETLTFYIEQSTNGGSVWTYLVTKNANSGSSVTASTGLIPLTTGHKFRATAYTTTGGYTASGTDETFFAGELYLPPPDNGPGDGGSASFRPADIIDGGTASSRPVDIYDGGAAATETDTAWVLDNTMVSAGKTLSNGDRTLTNTSGLADQRTYTPTVFSVPLGTGDTYYWEIECLPTGPARYLGYFALVSAAARIDPLYDYDSGVNPLNLESFAYRDGSASPGELYYDGSIRLSNVGGFGASDIVMWAFTPDTGEIWLGTNGVWLINRTPGVDIPIYTIAAGGVYYPTIQGRDVLAGGTISTRPADFTYAVPAGLIPLGRV